MMTTKRGSKKSSRGGKSASAPGLLSVLQDDTEEDNELCILLPYCHHVKAAARNTVIIMNLRACVDKHFDSSKPRKENKYRNIRPVVILKPFTDALYEMLIDEFPGKFDVPVPHTTRERRENEVDGFDYHFMKCSVREFRQQCDQGLFLEAGMFHDNGYGTKLQTVVTSMEKGKIPLLPIAANSVRKLRSAKQDLNPIVICIDVTKPESFKLLLHWPSYKSGTQTDFRDKNQSLTEAEARHIAEAEKRFAGELITDMVTGDSVEDVYQKVKDIVLLGHG